jgi:hypothetical protein
LGIGVELVGLLIELRKSGYFRQSTAVMEIGAQQLSSSFLSAPDQIADLGKQFGIKEPFSLASPPPPRVVHGDLELLDANAPFARDFWRWLGFDYGAIDIDGSPGSIPLDLNYDSVPRGARGKYDFVTNFGTTEHVANQLNAFEVIHDLTRHRGLMLHALPAQGMLNHGLVNYNFKFFWMLARSNGYRFIHAAFGHSRVPYNLPDDIVDFLNETVPSAGDKAREFQVRDAGILIVMQKAFDIAYVPPIDVQTGTKTQIGALKKRYWTVFQPDAFERLLAKESDTAGGASRANIWRWPIRWSRK